MSGFLNLDTLGRLYRDGIPIDTPTLADVKQTILDRERYYESLDSLRHHEEAVAYQVTMLSGAIADALDFITDGDRQYGPEADAGDQYAVGYCDALAELRLLLDLEPPEPE